MASRHYLPLRISLPRLLLAQCPWLSLSRGGVSSDPRAPASQRVVSLPLLRALAHFLLLESVFFKLHLTMEHFKLK